ncbi:hypothetical protein JMUB6875_36500 [Nocardia sp. JMUB6875]
MRPTAVHRENLREISVWQSNGNSGVGPRRDRSRQLTVWRVRSRINRARPTTSKAMVAMM